MMVRVISSSGLAGFSMTFFLGADSAFRMISNFGIFFAAADGSKERLEVSPSNSPIRIIQAVFIVSSKSLLEGEKESKDNK